MITDKIKKIKYKIPTISEVKLVWDSKSDDSIRPNTDQTSCLAALKIQGNAPCTQYGSYNDTLLAVWFFLTSFDTKYDISAEYIFAMATENAVTTKANCTRIIIKSTHIRNNASCKGPKTELNSKILENRRIRNMVLKP